jgi:two-component system, cell cycle response regulator DivK
MSGSTPPPVVLLLQNPDDRAMYEEFLRHHGVEPLCPVDTAEALQLAPTVNVVVTELMVPTVNDGVAFIERLRADPQTKLIPIVVVTSWAWQTERLRARDAGADLFLIKPCLPDELLRQIRTVVASTKLRGIRSKAVKTAPRPRRRRETR